MSKHCATLRFTLLVLTLTMLIPNRALAAPQASAPSAAAPSADATDDDSQPAKGDKPKLPWQAGPRSLELANGVRVALPAGFQFLAQPDAGKLMEKIGNLHNDDLLGVVVPEDERDFFVTIRFDGDGFIKDDDKLDGDEILKTIREGEADYNEERKKMGFSPIHAERWQEVPRYDASAHHLVWALVVADDEGKSVNYNTRILGRRGYVAVNLITDPERLEGYKGAAVELLRATSFAPGDRYEDFNSTTDKVAEYGLTGLVLGGAGFGLLKVAKIGLLAKFWKVILGVLIAGKKAIVAVFLAMGAFLKKIFGKKKNAAGPPAA